jgi:hypothetical protein
MINYSHPNHQVEEPLPGHFVLVGHKPVARTDEKGRHVVPPDTCYIAPEVPSEFLEAVLEARHVAEVEGAEAEHPHKKRGRGRPPKHVETPETETPTTEDFTQ